MTEERPPRAGGIKAGGLAALALVLYSLLTLVYLRPIWQTWTNHLTPDPEDPAFNLYVLKWGIHQAEAGFPDFWNANFYYPTRGATALSDHLLGPALAATALVRVVPGAIAAYNALLFATFPLTGLAVFWVLRRSGSSFLAAFFAGAMVAFSPFRWSQLNHLQILWFQWIPPALWFFDRLLAERRPRHAALFLLFYLLNLCGGCYLAYMIHFPLAVILASRWAAEGRELLRPAALRLFLPVAAVALAAAALLFAPYVRISHELKANRGSEEIAEFGATTLSFVTPASRNLYFGNPVRQWLEDHAGATAAHPLFRTENALFAGFLPTLLALAGIAAFVRRYRQRPASPLSRRRRIALAALLGIALAAYALADLATLKLARGTAFGGSLEGLGYAPLGLTLLGALAGWWWLRRRWGGNAPFDWSAIDPWERSVAALGVLCFLLTYPAIYVPLMRILPGMDGMRVSSRFYALVSFALAYFAAKALDRLGEAPTAPGGAHELAGAQTIALRPRSSAPPPTGTSRAQRRWALSLALAGFLAVEQAPKPVRFIPFLNEAEFPPVYAWLRDHSEVRALVEVPIRRNARETTYMYYSTLHWKPIANGFSGYHPPSFLALTEIVRYLPDEEGLALMRRMGLSHIVVHADELQRDRLQRRHRRRQGGPGLEFDVSSWEAELLGREVALAAVFGDDRVYRILPAPASASLPNLSGR